MFTVTGYPIEIEVEGKRALWRRPDTGDTPKSYPAPPMSSAKGLIEQIAFFSDKQAIILPYKVELCSPIVMDGYAFTYMGPLKKNYNALTFAECLLNPCYRIYGVSYSPINNMGAAHFLQDLFMRRLKKGQCFSWPSLGLKQMITDYYGPFREKTQINPINLDLGPMPLLVFDKDGRKNPVYNPNAKIKNGVLEYAERFETNQRHITVTWNF